MKAIYQKVVLDKKLSDPVRTAVESEFAPGHGEMRDLKHVPA